MSVPNTGAYPVNGATLAGKVRILVGDTDPKPVTGQPTLGEYAWYSDAELEALGEMHDGNPKRVAIWVLSMVAVNQALLLRKWTSEDLQIDGPAIAAGIEKTLARLQKEVDWERTDDDSFFEVYDQPGPVNHRVPQVNYPFYTFGW